MKRLLLLSLASGALLGLASCSDDTKCGTGTSNQDGVCVPDATCGAGTVEMDGQCVPDGSMICTQGTKFNPDTSTCEVDPAACGPGTALLDGVCVNEDDARAADIQEAAEPNDQNGAGMMAVPALDASTTFHGCITPSSTGEADFDPWVVTTTSPALIEITADGVHGLAAGFAVVDASNNTKLASWQRLGINLTGDTSRRQVFLPAAGAYLLIMDDSRSLFLGSPAGGTNTCYFGTLKRVAIPAATALTVPQTTGMDSGDARFLSFNATATADILDVTQTSSSESMSPSFVVMRNNVLSGVATGDTANGVPPFWTAGGLDTTGDQVTIVVDSEYNFALTPQAYTLDSFHVAAQALPTTGTSVTATKKNGANPTAPWFDINYFYLDVATAGQIVHFNLTSTVAAQMRIVRRDVFTPAGAFDAVATINTMAGTTAFSGQYVRFPTAGRYYFMAIDPAGTAAATYQITATLTNMSTAAITYGTPMTAQALTAQGASFYTLDTQAAYEWIELGVPTAANWGAGGARITLYDLAGAGWLNNNYAALQAVNQPVDGSAPIGRVTLDDARDYLVRVEPTAAPLAGATFTLDVKERAHVNLGTIATATPINRTGMDNTPAGGTLRYLIKSTANNRLQFQVTPVSAAVDIRIDRRNAAETSVAGADTGAAGAAETLNATFTANPPWLAITITNKSPAVATDNNLVITALPPL
jgi:hypothetical protein